MINDLNQLLMRGDEVEKPDKIRHVPCIIPDDKYPALIIDRHTIRAWCELDEDFRPELLSPIGYLAHEVSSIIRECGVEDFFGGCWHIGNWEVTRAVRLGLTYRQPFLVDLYARHYELRTQEGMEYDSDVQFEIKHITCLPQHEVLARWEEWTNRT